MKSPEYQQGLALYNSAATAAGDLVGLAWASMVYRCSDAGSPPRPVPPGWDRLVESAREGYWEERGGVPETIKIGGVRMFPATPAGCGHEEVRYLCVGVEHPRLPNTPRAAEYPCHYWFVPSPFVCGQCPKCGLPMKHADWSCDEEWWPPTPVPKGASFFRVPGLERAKEYVAQGYGGAEFVLGSVERSSSMTETETTAEAQQTIRPLGDRVLVRPDEQTRKTAGGIIIPENVTEKPKTGVVLAVGSGNVAADTGDRTAPDVVEGDRVIFSQYGGIDVTLGDTDYLILREGDILGVVVDA